jgi:predicted transcriptional regulator
MRVGNGSNNSDGTCVRVVAALVDAAEALGALDALAAEVDRRRGMISTAAVSRLGREEASSEWRDNGIGGFTDPTERTITELSDGERSSLHRRVIEKVSSLRRKQRPEKR